MVRINIKPARPRFTAAIRALTIVMTLGAALSLGACGKYKNNAASSYFPQNGYNGGNYGSGGCIPVQNTTSMIVQFSGNGIAMGNYGGRNVIVGGAIPAWDPGWYTLFAGSSYGTMSLGGGGIGGGSGGTPTQLSSPSYNGQAGGQGYTAIQLTAYPQSSNTISVSGTLRVGTDGMQAISDYARYFNISNLGNPQYGTTGICVSGISLNLEMNGISLSNVVYLMLNNGQGFATVFVQ